VSLNRKEEYTMTQQALIVIDVQKDYFAGGLFPLWNTEAVLEQTLRAVSHAKSQGIPVLLVQHIADTSQVKRRFLILTVTALRFTRVCWQSCRTHL
jgi:nicotinamidase-related amidase